MNIRWNRRLAFASLATALLMAGFALAQQPQGLAAFANPSTLPDLDPSTGFSSENAVMANVYETLTFYTVDSTVIPKLATGWEIAEDGLSWTFTLREGVTFHDGSPLTAAAVKASLERTIELGLGAAFIYFPVASIEVVDDLTVRFNLNYEAPMDLILSSGYAAWIMSPTAVAQEGAWFNAGNGSGTGPYTIESYSPGENLVLRAFPDYWGGWSENQFGTVVIDIIEEPTLREQMIRSGETDFTFNLPFDSYPALSRLTDVVVDRTPSFQMLYGLLNTRKAPLNNPTVRRALAYSFPYDLVTENLYGGLGNPAVGAVPSGMWGALTEGGASYDPERARHLLSEAGYPDGGFELLFTYAAGDLEEQLVGELWRADLADLGVDLQIQGLTWEAQWDLAKSDPATAQDIFTMYWWPTYITPYDFLFSMFHSEDEPFFNLSYYSNPDFDTLIDSADALSGTNREEAADRFREAQRILNGDAAAIFMVEVPDVHVIRSDIRGYINNPAYPHVVFWHDLSR